MQILELLNSPTENYKTSVEPRDFEATMKIGEREMMFYALLERNAVMWEVGLMGKTDSGYFSFRKTKDQNALKVFSFCKRALTEFIHRYHPSMFLIAALESRLDLQQFYRKLFTKYSIPGYEMEEQSKDQDVHFIFSKK